MIIKVKRKLVLTVLLGLFVFSANADTLLDYGGDKLSEWEFQAVYKEKYFEYNAYYNYFDLFGYYEYETEDKFDGPVLTGMKHDFIVRCGLPDNHTVNLDFLYIYQRIEEIDNNNLQAISLFAEKFYDNGLGLVVGLKIPMVFDIVDDIRFINNQDEFNVIVGGFLEEAKSFFNYSLRATAEINIFPDNYKGLIAKADYEGSLELVGSAGINIFKNDGHSINVVLETTYLLDKYTTRRASAWYIVPQVKVEFYNSFYFIAGVEFFGYAENVFLNKFFIEGENSVSYLMKITYVVNSAKRAKEEEMKDDKAVQEKDKEDVKEQDWKEIDEEMIPDSWKDAAKSEKKAERGEETK